jgi:hypothetical protein
MKRIAVLAVAMVLNLTTSAWALIPSQEANVVTLRALDKMTARVEELTAEVDHPLRFGNLVIVARACRVTPPEETPEAAAYLEVSEEKSDKTSVSVFHGWMFASSPALSAMEDPIYDIWVIGCKSVATK